MTFPSHARRAAAAISIAVLAATSPAFASGDHNETTDDEHGAHVTRLLMPIMNSRRGMDLFVEKGCYSCHAVNGVGGHDAAALDAHEMDEFMNPFDLAAKMWTMASIMIPAQEDALGAQIEFTGDELADIIAFLHDDEQQHHFTEALLSEEQMAAMHHDHGGAGAEEAHEEEIGHAHAEGTHDEAEEPDSHGHDDGDADDQPGKG